MLYNKSSLKIPDGNTVWLERDRINGNKVDVSIFFGRRLQVSGLPDILRVLPALYAPNRAMVPPSLHGRADGYILRFKPTSLGFYTVVADMEPVILTRTRDGYREGPKGGFADARHAGLFRQTAKALVEVGKDVSYDPMPVDIPLDIVPNKAYPEPDKKIELTVYYEGQRRQGLDVTAFSRRLKAERTYATDKKGSVRIPIDAGGTWSFTVTYADPLRKAEGLYDEAVFTTTLAMSAAAKYGL